MKCSAATNLFEQYVEKICLACTSTTIHCNDDPQNCPVLIKTVEDDEDSIADDQYETWRETVHDRQVPMHGP